MFLFPKLKNINFWINTWQLYVQWFISHEFPRIDHKFLNDYMAIICWEWFHTNYHELNINLSFGSSVILTFNYLQQILYKNVWTIKMMIPSEHLHLRGFFTSYLICHILVWCWTNPEGVARVQAGGGVRSTEPLLKVWCEQQPRRGGRMATS